MARRWPDAHARDDLGRTVLIHERATPTRPSSRVSFRRTGVDEPAEFDLYWGTDAITFVHNTPATDMVESLIEQLHAQRKERKDATYTLTQIRAAFEACDGKPTWQRMLNQLQRKE